MNDERTDEAVFDNESTFGDVRVNPKDLYSLRDTAKLLGVSQTIVWLWVNANKLPSVRIGNTRAVSIADARKVNTDMQRLRQSRAGRSQAQLAGMV